MGGSDPHRDPLPDAGTRLAPRPVAAEHGDAAAGEQRHRGHADRTPEADADTSSRIHAYPNADANAQADTDDESDSSANANAEGMTSAAGALRGGRPPEVLTMGTIEPVFRPSDQGPQGSDPTPPDRDRHRRTTMADVSRLRRSLDAALHDGTSKASRQLEAEAASLEREAEDRLADAGAMLVPRRHYWSAPDELWLRFERADRLVEEMRDADGRLAQRRMQRPSAERDQLESARYRAAAELREILLEVAQSAGPRTALRIREVRPLFEEAGRLSSQAASLRQRAEDLRSGLLRTDPENGSIRGG